MAAVVSGRACCSCSCFLLFFELVGEFWLLACKGLASSPTAAHSSLQYGCALVSCADMVPALVLAAIAVVSLFVFVFVFVFLFFCFLLFFVFAAVAGAAAGEAQGKVAREGK